MAAVDVYRPSPIYVTDPSKFNNVITIMDNDTPFYGCTNNKNITIGDVLTSILEDFKYNVDYPVGHQTPEHLFLMKQDGTIMFDFDVPVSFEDNKAMYRTVFIKEHLNHDPELLENVRKFKRQKIEKELSNQEIIEMMKQQKYSPDITVTIETLTRQFLNITINPDDTVSILKQKIHSLMGIPPIQFNLTYNKKRLEDEAKISDTGIKDNDRVYLIKRLRGGMFHPTSGRSGNYLLIRTAYFDMDTKKEDGKSRRPKKPIVHHDEYRRTFYSYD